MRLQDLITTPGGARSNEDRAGQRGTLAWVVDGATDLYDDAVLPAERDVVWLVDFVAGLLTEAGEEGSRGPAHALLEDIADRVQQEQVAYGFPPERIPPACSIAVTVDQGDGYEVARIGDATGVITGARIEVVATDFFDRREQAAVDDQRNGDTAEQVHTAMLGRRWQTITNGATESVFSGHPRRQLRPHTAAGRWSEVDQILLCTDGFARLVNDYARYPEWSRVAIDARDRGLAYLEKLIRDIERALAGPTARFKRSDDVAAVLLAPDEAEVTRAKETTP